MKDATLRITIPLEVTVRVDSTNECPIMLSVTNGMTGCIVSYGSTLTEAIENLLGLDDGQSPDPTEAAIGWVLYRAVIAQFPDLTPATPPTWAEEAHAQEEGR